MENHEGVLRLLRLAKADKYNGPRCVHGFSDYSYLIANLEPVAKYISLTKTRPMKTMTCKELGGACNQTFSANTFDEIAKMVSKHAREMVQQGDAAHIDAMNEMRRNMSSPDAMNAWMDDKRKAFNALPNDIG
jgi:predicted small metal-binding protein